MQGIVNTFTPTFGSNNVSVALNMELPTASPSNIETPTIWQSVATSGPITTTLIGTVTRNDCINIGLRIYDEAFNLVASVDGTQVCTNSFSFTASVDPGPGCYLVQVILPTMFAGSPDPNDVLDATYTLSATAMIFNPVVYTADDIEQCPKMLLPPLTEDTGDWYADQTAAQTAINDHVKSCDVYIGLFATQVNVSIVGSNITVSSSSVSYLDAWCSYNAVAGQTIGLTWDPRLEYGELFVYDYNGGLVFHQLVTFGSPPITSTSLPYTGRYIIHAIATDLGSGTPPVDMVISVTGTASVNSVQALYDVSLSCPARLDC